MYMLNAGVTLTRSIEARQYDESVLFEGVEVGRHCRIRRAIIDKRVKIPANADVGYDAERDRARGIVVSPEGISVVSTDVDFGSS